MFKVSYKNSLHIKTISQKTHLIEKKVIAFLHKLKNKVYPLFFLNIKVKNFSVEFFIVF